MRRTFLATVLIFACIVTYAQKLPASALVGTWHSQGEDVELKFEFFESEGKYFARLLWATTMFEKDGITPKKDPKNPDENLRSRSRQNIVNVTNLVFDDGEYTGGKLYNPDDGDTYSLKVKLKSINEMEFRGYMAIPLLGKTMAFKRE